MRRRFAVVLFLILFGFGVVIERFGLLQVHVNLIVDPRGVAPETRGRPAGAKNHPASASLEIGTRGSPNPAADSTSTVSPGGEEKPKAGEASSADPEKDKVPWVGLDIARISRNGPSVFAGKSAPFAQVTVLEGTTAVATATALANGDWSVVTDHKFASSDPQINLRAVDGSEKKPDAPVDHDSSRSTPARQHEAVRLEEATPDSIGQARAVPAGAPPPSARLIKEFEDVVATAREEAKQRDIAASSVNGAVSGHVASPTTPSAQALSEMPIPPASESPSPAEIAPDLTRPPAKTTTVPMTFVYDEATLTAEGHGAAKLLLEYLRLKHFGAVTLSGHADERGSSGYNMDLSRQRLDTIMRVLRDGGYQGKIDLLPKGASEPFAGVDRSRYPREELMQLDRRVELRIAK